LRVAVTKNQWSSNQTNAVYVLDQNLEKLGYVGGLARDESIYAARFVGDRAYLVTFERVDPLFVIDLSVPSEPVVLGELEMPGFSDYLHPWSSDLILGFGMQTSDRGEWVQTDGLKIAMYDVSDPENPEEVSQIEIGGQGSSSEILYNHRALLVDREHGWFAIPVYEYAKAGGVIEYGPDQLPDWNVTEFQGLYVFKVSSAGVISFQGKITHHLPTDFPGGYDYVENSYLRDISRGAFIGDVLYATSLESIGAYKLATLEQIQKVDWPPLETYSPPVYYEE
jgi:inhibitor of cysteine peptidase